jgi:hypothetical protein
MKWVLMNMIFFPGLSLMANVVLTKGAIKERECERKLK